MINHNQNNVTAPAGLKHILAGGFHRLPLVLPLPFAIMLSVPLLP
jgi:hypothetical protein